PFAPFGLDGGAQGGGVRMAGGAAGGAAAGGAAAGPAGGAARPPGPPTPGDGGGAGPPGPAPPPRPAGGARGPLGRGGGTARAAGQGGDAATPQATPKLASDYAALPLPFELNAGQADPAVRYLSRSPGFALFLTDQGATLALARPDDHATRDLLTLR